MQITTHSDYALRLLIFLNAHPGAPVGIAQIADAYGISANHLAKVAQTLTHAGWVDTHRGRGGGLTLNPAVHDVTVGDIFRHTETNRRLVECFGDDSTCPIEPACGLKTVLQKASAAFFAELDRHHLRDLVRKPNALRKLIPLVVKRETT